MNAVSNAPQPSDRPRPPLFARRQGEGDPVVCLHSSTGSHAQWRVLADALAGHCATIAPDLHGHGRSPAWPAHVPGTLHVDAHGASGCWPAADDGFAPRGVHLVGHSYGGAVALQIALCQPRRVRSLTLYEPVPFGVLRGRPPGDPARGEIEDIARSVGALLRGGDPQGAARTFVNYWGGSASWESMGAAQRAAVLARIGAVPRHFAALFRATWSPRLLACLTMPVLLIRGANTRAPARQVAEWLVDALPRAQHLEIAGAGHLGAMTHAPLVAAAIVRHLEANGLEAPAVPAQRDAAFA